MFHGLSAFPLTPFSREKVDDAAFVRLVRRLADAGVDSITALGSTGSYAYLTRQQRQRVAHLTVDSAGGAPVIIGIGSLRTRNVLELAEDAQAAGAAAVLLAPVTYQALTPEDVYGLYEDVTASLSVPLIVYDNPGTTHFTFTDELYVAIAGLPHVASIKIPGVPAGPGAARARIEHLRGILPSHVTIGVSGDAFAGEGLSAGCELWYSVIGGTLPRFALELTRAVDADPRAAADWSSRLQPLWDLFSRHGSLRVTAVIAEELDLVAPSSLPLPIRGLRGSDRADVVRVIDELDLTE